LNAGYVVYPGKGGESWSEGIKRVEPFVKWDFQGNSRGKFLNTFYKYVHIKEDIIN
jgi:phage pi2 protein 07